MINCFEHFDNLLSLTNPAIFHDVCNVKLQVYAKGLAWSGGVGQPLKPLFLVSIC